MALAPFLFSTVAMRIRNLYLVQILKYRQLIGIRKTAVLMINYLITDGDYNELNIELKRLKKIVEDIVTYAGLKKIPIEERTEFAKKHFSPTFDFNDIEAREKEAAEKKVVEEKNALAYTTSLTNISNPKKER